MKLGIPHILGLILCMLASISAHSMQPTPVQNMQEILRKYPGVMQDRDEQLAFVRDLDSLVYTPSLLTHQDRQQPLSFFPLEAFSDNPVFINNTYYSAVATAYREGDSYTLYRFFKKDVINAQTQTALFSALLLQQGEHLKSDEINYIKQSLEKNIDSGDADVSTVLASIAMSNYHRKREAFRPALDSIMQGLTLLSGIPAASEEEVDLLTLAVNYELAAFYYELQDMKSASDIYQKIIFEGSAYISEQHQAAHTRRLIDVFFQRQEFKQALPHAERLLNQRYDDPSSLAQAEFIYGKLLEKQKMVKDASGYYTGIMTDTRVRNDIRAKACRALYHMSMAPRAFTCLNETMGDVEDPEMLHYWHRVQYFNAINNNDIKTATDHMKKMVRYIDEFMSSIILRQSQRLLLEYNVDMAKKQAEDLKQELTIKKAFLAQSQQNEALYRVMLSLVVLAVIIGIIALVRARKNRSAVEKQALTDPLTGIKNRRAILRDGEGFLSKSQHVSPWAIMLLDLDHFKNINDTYGHDGGDAILKSFCRSCEGVMPDGAMLGRYGGEEFLLLIPHCTPENAEQFFLRLQKSLLNCHLPEDNGEKRVLDVTVSAGVAVVNEMQLHKDDEYPALDKLIKLADDNVYHSKAKGRDQLTLSEYRSK